MVKVDVTECPAESLITNLGPKLKTGLLFLADGDANEG